MLFRDTITRSLYSHLYSGRVLHVDKAFYSHDTIVIHHHLPLNIRNDTLHSFYGVVHVDKIHKRLNSKGCTRGYYNSASITAFMMYDVIPRLRLFLGWFRLP